MDAAAISQASHLRRDPTEGRFILRLANADAEAKHTHGRSFGTEHLWSRTDANSGK